jgi:hypothetical protein
MSPLPLAGIPVTLLVLSRVQMNNVPETLPVNAIVEIGPEQIVCVTGLATTFGVGLTVSVKLIGVDGQPPGKNVLKAKSKFGNGPVSDYWHKLDHPDNVIMASTNRI